MANWSEELFTVHKVKRTLPVCYVIIDDANVILKGSFYEYELQKIVKLDHIYCIEALLAEWERKNKTQCLSSGQDTHHHSTVGSTREISESIKADAMSVPVSDELMESSETHRNSNIHQQWEFCGCGVRKSEIVFFCQIIILYTVIIISIFNLTKGNSYSNLWTALLSSSLGYLLPHPTIKKR